MTRLALSWHTAQRTSQLLVAAHPLTSLRELFGEQADGRLFVNDRAVSAESSLAAAGIRDGASVGSRPVRPTVPVAPPGSLALLVVSGPAAGASCEIPAHGTVVGREGPLPLGDNEVSGRHFQVTPAGDQVEVTDLGSTNGTMVAGEWVTAQQSRNLVPGELIWAGRTALTVTTAPERDAALSDAPDGRRRYSRSPRLIEAPRTPRLALPEPPPEPQKASFPMLAVVVPVLAGVLMAVLLHQPEFLAFVALSPVMLIGNAITERRRGKRGHRQRMADFEERTERAQADLAAARQAELRYRRQVHPDPASLLLIATAPSRRLWERQSGDTDFLALRIGTGHVPWTAKGKGKANSASDAPDQLRDAPVVLPLTEHGAAGLTGDMAATRALARAMLLSAAVLHSPRELTITVLTSHDTAADWDWVRWLPHTRHPDSHPCLVRIGNDETSIRQRLTELNAVFESPENDVTHLVVLDGSYSLRLGFEFGALLRGGPAAGMYFLCLDQTIAQLPTECRHAVVELTDDAGSTVARVLRAGDEHDDVAADILPAAVCETAARALASLTEAGGGRTPGGGLPSAVRFLDAAGLEPPDPRQIQARWTAGGRTTEALLGVRADGPFVLDLAQGPHLLVAGTTGSGKSELLQTLVSSLAVANRPDAMNFVLIDYKGGAAFRAFRSLPHTVGMLTDLDEFLVERALVSLRAELQRRKAILDRADKSNIGRYWDALSGMPGGDPLPRLVIVVDEFAVMSEQLPDQLASLIDIGRQGRSLGIHLVLATQRPAGVVTADLRSNINLRIALRVASPEDSRDVIDAVDAARIPVEGCAGRAYAWLGGGRPVAFQAARVGGLRPGALRPGALRTGARPGQARAQVIPLRWEDLGYPLPQDREAEPDQEETQQTDQAVLVDAISAAARDARLDGQRSPWSPPLPRQLTLTESTDQNEGTLQLRYGLVDRPREQRQVPAVFDIARGGHLLVAGAPQSGRSTVLRTLAGALAAHVEPDEVQLYVLDGGGALAALSALPHCGAVVTAAEPERVGRLLDRLSGELATRIRQLSASGHSDLTEFRATQPTTPPAQRPPFLLLFVDRYDVFLTALEHIDGGRLLGQLQQLMRDGLAAGIRVIATGDRTLLTGRLGALAEQKVVLRMADRTDFALVGLHARTIPKDMPDGRGFHLPSGDLLQVAMLSAQAQGATENQVLRELAGKRAPHTRPPFRVDQLPPAISEARALALPSTGPGILIGVGGDELHQIRIETPGLLVLGPPGSGRSTALAVQVRSLSQAGAHLVLVSPRRSALPAALDPAAIIQHLTTSDAAAAEQLAKTLADASNTTVVVDDAELLNDTPLGQELTASYRRIRDSGHRLLAAAAAETSFGLRGLLPELAKTRCGLVLEPASTTDGSLLGARLPASVLAPGVRLRGALIHGGRVVAVQVPALAGTEARESDGEIAG
ncbi:MAG TPA: FtsK/SpoIIIE domain-containing protein [Streptosporangiaceae bacterium]|nr:FtsK/SpoIIIE domain-containing protein [Streptosporangiaceae bacterium]